MSTSLSTDLVLLVFDMDGTLVDSQHNIVAAMSRAFSLNGLPEPDPDKVRSIIGLSLDEAVSRVLPPDAQSKVVAVREAYKDSFFHLRAQPDHSEPLFPGARQAIEAAADAGWLLGIATGKSRRGVDAALDRHNLHGFFQTISTADDGPGKPHPHMLIKAMGETGVEAASTVMVGDTTFDMEMAVKAGVHAIGVDWGYHPPAHLTAIGAKYVIGDFAQLNQRVTSALNENSLETYKRINRDGALATAV